MRIRFTQEFRGWMIMLAACLLCVSALALPSHGVLAEQAGTQDPALLAAADQFDPSESWYNGDDAVVLRKGAAVIDAIGQVGYRPTGQWGTDPTATQDNTIRRISSVCAGDTNPDDSFDPATEWVGYAQNTFDGLGAHTSDCLVPPPPLEPVINEFSADNWGTDADFVEVYGDPSTDYSAYTVLEIEGDTTGAGYVVEVAPVGTTDASGLYLEGITPDALGNGTLTLVLVKDYTGTEDNDLDTNNDGVFDLTPWTALVDAVARNDGGVGDRTYGPTLGPNYDGLGPSAPGAASRLPDGLDTDAAGDWLRNDFDLAGIPGHPGTPVWGEAYNTPGAPNQAVPESCVDPYLAIPAVQGDGAASPLLGAEVAVEGVVVGDFQTGGLDGYYLQDPAGDGNPATSDGIFIYAPGGTAVSVGDEVRVRGTVSEFSGLTEITPGQVWVCSPGPGPAVAPTTLTLPLAGLDAFEPFEGMLVTLPQALFISEFYDFDRYGEIVLTTTAQYQPTAVYEPGSPEAAALAAAHALGRITLDDGRPTQNPDPARHPSGATFDLAHLFRGGDTVAGVTGILDHSFGSYRIQPTQGADYVAANPRPAAPAEVGGSLRVASFNVLNYFTTLGSRGADTPEEFTRQRTKIIAALAALDADVAGLIEIENNTAAVADLVTGLNEAVGADTYAYIDAGVIGTDQIKVALIYQPARVTPLGDYAILDSSVDPLFDTRNRPVLAQTFQEVSGTGIFTVAVNHLKSKGSDCGVADPDEGDGAGNCNLTRKAAAEALVRWLALDPTGSGDEDFLIIGDLNSHQKEDPIDALLAGGYTDLLAQYVGESAYTYRFDGQLGYLDYALAGSGLLDQVTGATVWHINADEPDLLDYDMTYKATAQDALYEPNAYRASDHDAILVGLDLDDIPTPGPFGKSAPLDSAAGVARNPSLSWGAAAGAASYEYCYDTTDDDACSSWVSTGTTAGASLSGLAYSTTYYWQVRARNVGGLTYANDGAWWSFTTGAPVSKQMTFHSTGMYDGWVLESGETSGVGGSRNSTATTARVGDDASDRQYRSLLHFNTAGLPDNAVITGVTLRVKKQSVAGTSPFNTHGSLTVDVRTGSFGTAALANSDFKAAASGLNVGKFAKTAVSGWYRATLKSAVFPQVNRTGSTQFRLRFTVDDNDDRAADYLAFYTGDSTAANRPDLIITYYLP